MADEVLWTKTIPAIDVPHRIELVASSGLPPAELVSCAFVFAISPQRELLLTFDDRPDRGWDVPGGHLDEGETPAGAALRELEEETGVALSSSDLEPTGWTRITLDQRPPQYRYPYPMSYMTFYLARLEQAVDPPGPQPGTECSDARWMSLDAIHQHCKNPDWLPLIVRSL